MPQFAERSTYRFQVQNFSIGIAFFLIGLFKKVVLADEIQPFVGPVFEASPGHALTVIEAWGGALAYTLQLYFDFSGYSDMAIGLSKMFNVDLPLNFNSPYKATSIIEFWRRWHMTLSRFLRDYLYVGLGGNRKGPIRRYANLLVTMLLGGLWHGAGWTFIVWGGVHGVLLVVNHGWRNFRSRRLGHDLSQSSPAGRAAAVMATFGCVVVAWVFFRATTLTGAVEVLRGMFGVEWLRASRGVARPPGCLPAGGCRPSAIRCARSVQRDAPVRLECRAPRARILVPEFASARRQIRGSASTWRTERG